MCFIEYILFYFELQENSSLIHIADLQCYRNTHDIYSDKYAGILSCISGRIKTFSSYLDAEI